MSEEPLPEVAPAPPVRRPWAVRVARVLPAVVLAPAALAGAYVVVQTDQDDALELQHPFDVGTTWVYTVEDGGEDSGFHTRTVVGETRLGNDPAIGVRSAYTLNPFTAAASSEVSYLGRGTDHVLQFGIRGSDGFSEIDPPAPAYAADPTTGTRLDHEGTFGALEVASQVEVTETTDVVVGARTFRDCAHYVSRVQLTNPDTDQGVDQEVDEWVCPGFGTVRTRTRVPSLDKDVSEELVAFHGRHDDWVAPGAAMPWSDAAGRTGGEVRAGATSGVGPARTSGVEVSPDPGLGDRLVWSDSRQEVIDWPPVLGGATQVVADHGGDVAATDAVTGEVRWRLRVPGPVVAPPTVVGDVVLLAPADKTLLAVGLLDGTTRWIHELDDQVSAAPTTLGDVVVVPSEDARLTALDVADGSVAWRRDVTALVRHDPAADSRLVVVAGDDGTVTAVDAAGRDAWSQTLENPAVAGPVVADGVVVLADDLGVLYGYDVDDGTLAWQARPADYTTSELAVSDGAVVAVEEGGHLEAYDLASGERRWRADVGDVEVTPLGLGDRVLTVTAQGRVEVRETAGGDLVEQWDVPVTPDGTDASVAMAPTVLDDTVVIGGATPGSDSVFGLLAYALSDDDEDGAAGSGSGTRGVVLRGEERLLGPDSLADRPYLEGDLLLAVDKTERLLRSTSPDLAETALVDEALYPGPTSQGGLAVVQVGEQFRGFDAAGPGAEPLWTYDAGALAGPGSTPAITDDTVFLPVQATALVALERDGTLRWRRDIPDALGTSAPVPVDGGDVLFGPGGLTRYDGRTGRPEWSVPDTVLPGAPAYDDGVVVAAVYDTSGVPQLLCLDAQTGEVRWSVPGFAADLRTGHRISPAVHDGVVVAVDASSVAHAYAVDDGTELWQVDLGSSPAGSPYLSDGLAYLATGASEENLYQRDYRVTAIDARTGRLRAAYEPPSPGFSVTPALSGTADGRLLVPFSAGLTSAVLILEATP